MRVIGSREFNQDIGGAKRAAATEPVFVTDRGRPTHVLMSIESYRQLTGGGGSILDQLSRPGLPRPAADSGPVLAAVWGEF